MSFFTHRVTTHIRKGDADKMKKAIKAYDDYETQSQFMRCAIIEKLRNCGY